MIKEILKKREIYSHDVKDIQHISTATSDVFLTGNFAYKICKPVSLGFLDFSTIERRKDQVVKEIKLNSKFSPELYLGIVKIIENGDGHRVVDLDNEGEAIEYGIKMKQLDPKSVGGEIVKERRLEMAEIFNLAEELVKFHKIAESSKEISKYGKTDTVKFNWDENFEQTEKCINELISHEDFNFIKKKIDNFIEANQHFFEKRVAAGKVKHCHGDFHLENVFFLDKKAIIFDGICFNLRFPCCDVASEVAFMAMDLDSRGFHQDSEMFVRNYVDLTSDAEILRLMNFYKCYRAYIRGKIAFFNSEDNSEEKDKARKYFNLAREYADLL